MPRVLSWTEASCEPRLKELSEMPTPFGNMSCQPFQRDIVVGRDSHQQGLEYVGENVCTSTQRGVIARHDAERVSERIEIGRRQRRDQDRCQFGGIESSLFQ